MRKKAKQILSKIFIATAAALMPVAVSAQTKVNDGLRDIKNPFSGFSSRLTNSTNAIDFIASIIELMLFFAGAVAVLFIIIGGFWYLTSAGNEEQAEKGKNAVVNAIIGIVVIVLSYVIINAVTGTLSRR